MNYEKLISDVNLAFAGNQFEVSLKKAQEAINKDDSKAEGYVCAGKAALSLGSAEMAEHYFKTATEKDKNNGNIFFLLGYAQAMSGHSSKTVQSLTRALESNCDTSVKGQIYKMISMINTEQGDYGNALTNLSQAEDYIGLDYEILQQRAVGLLLCSAGLYPHDKRTFKRCGRCWICIFERTCRGSRQNRLCGNTCQYTRSWNVGGMDNDLSYLGADSCNVSYQI